MKTMLIIATIATMLNPTVTPTKGIIDTYNRADNCYTIVDERGEAWFYEGDEKDDLHIGDPVVVMMNNNGTDNIYDDEIVFVGKVKG